MKVKLPLLLLMMVLQKYKLLTEKDISTGNITLQGPHENGLYPKRFASSTQNKLLSSITISAVTWHQRLAHHSFQVLQKVCDSLSLTGIAKTPLFYEECQLGRSH